MFRLAIGEGAELRLLEPHHAEELFSVIDSNREMLREWLPWVDFTESADDTRIFVEEWLKKLAARQEVTAGIWSQGRIAGVIGARLDPISPKAELGYWLGAEFQGRGLVTSAARALLSYLFEERALHRIEIHCSPENPKSGAVAERLGFQQGRVAAGGGACKGSTARSPLVGAAAE